MCPPAHRPGAMTTAAAARCAPRPRPAPRLARPSSRVGRGCGGAEAGAGPGLWRPPRRVVSGPNIARWPELGSAAGHQALFYLPTLHWHEECRNSFLVSHHNNPPPPRIVVTTTSYWKLGEHFSLSHKLPHLLWFWLLLLPMTQRSSARQLSSHSQK